MLSILPVNENAAFAGGIFIFTSSAISGVLNGENLLHLVRMGQLTDHRRHLHRSIHLHRNNLRDRRNIHRRRKAHALTVHLRSIHHRMERNALTVRRRNIRRGRQDSLQMGQTDGLKVHCRTRHRKATTDVLKVHHHTHRRRATTDEQTDPCCEGIRTEENCGVLHSEIAHAIVRIPVRSCCREQNRRRENHGSRELTSTLPNCLQLIRESPPMPAAPRLSDAARSENAVRHSHLLAPSYLAWSRDCRAGRSTGSAGLTVTGGPSKSLHPAAERCAKRDPIEFLRAGFHPCSDATPVSSNVNSSSHCVSVRHDPSCRDRSPHLEDEERCERRVPVRSNCRLGPAADSSFRGQAGSQMNPDLRWND